MKQLYMFYLGGNAGHANIEVHDVQFIACNSWQEAVPALKALWFGDRDKIHIDGWQIVSWADGYDISLSEVPPNQAEKLYFVNVGGYRRGTLAEAHDFGLFVAATPAEAKQKALAALLPDSLIPHKDNLKDVDNLLPLSEVGGLHIHLTANPAGKPSEIGFQGYQPI
ncbi:DUF1543 domain-containing protein [Bergeriella denitrificans]|uniref:Domain of Uncharacterized Function (DUF1543) n=1 Tax=Bergeriella denitrificans TaxID=494 RepID=A0A378UJD9_BERDE|nr:DUF1543 domain-containing protein [Bergeriella denitrificans]STZ76789.1 Domain of Uncharacterised Function (DUF1543) [Bergeriella denitrificans]